MLNQSGNDIVMSKYLINNRQKVSVKRSSEKYFSTDPISTGYVLCPHIVIQRIHGGGKEVRVASDLKQVYYPQSEGKNEDCQNPYLVSLFVRNSFEHAENIPPSIYFVKQKQVWKP